MVDMRARLPVVCDSSVEGVIDLRGTGETFVKKQLAEAQGGDGSTTSTLGRTGGPLAAEAPVTTLSVKCGEGCDRVDGKNSRLSVRGGGIGREGARTLRMSRQMRPTRSTLG
jgi:hypothetical protein